MTSQQPSRDAHQVIHRAGYSRLDAATTAVGGTPVWPPADAVQPGARFAYVKDPEDNLIELIQLPSSS